MYTTTGFWVLDERDYFHMLYPVALPQKKASASGAHTSTHPYTPTSIQSTVFPHMNSTVDLDLATFGF